MPANTRRTETLHNQTNLLTGTIIKSTGSWYQVRLPDNREMVCRIVGKLRLGGLSTTNPVAVGDQVEILPESAEKGLIKQILPRKNYVIRQSPRRKHDLHLIAANVDQAIVIVTLVEPNLKPGFVDRFLLMTEPYDIPTAIVVNKADLYDEDMREVFHDLTALYSPIGYPSLLVSAKTGEGMPDLRTFLQGKTTLVGGQSGVGKSTLVNAIQPGLGLRTGDLSDYSGKGQHTTTFAEMFSLDMGGDIIDTPGIKMLAFNNLAPLDVAHNFREFFALAPSCKFGGQCLHRNEPHCAVREAVSNGELSPLRYQHYLAILDDIAQQNHWEIHEM